MEDHFLPMLPFARQVISIDFGSGGRCNWPDSVSARLVDHNSSNDGHLGETYTYSSRNGPELADRNRWVSDGEGYDLSIATSEAEYAYNYLGNGFAITGSAKEQQFLCSKGIYLVGVVDEESLFHLLEKRYSEKGFTYEGPNYWPPSSSTCINISHPNSYYRSWRLARLIADYKKLYFETLPRDREQALRTIKSLGNLILNI